MNNLRLYPAGGGDAARIPAAVNSFIVVLLAVSVLSAAPGKQVFTGTITDDMCTGKAGHAAMRMGPTDSECTLACVSAHGASYVLDTGKAVYTLSDQRTPEKFAGQKVRVSGTLDAKTKTISVDSIGPIKAAKK